MGSLLLKFLVGGCAGLVAWAIMEPSHPLMSDPRWTQWEGMTILLLGAMIGFAVGGLEGFTRGGKRHTIIGASIGLVFGAIGSSFGIALGGGISKAIFGTALTTGNLVTQMMARTVAFIPMGLFLGAAIGASSFSGKRAIQGATGGAIGAAIGGMSFDIIGSMTASAQLSAQGISRGEVGGPSRAITFLIIGAGIGLFIGLVDLLARSAWLRLNLGRKEGKEWSIDGAQTFIGRSEGAQVPLFGDPNVAQVHASILKQQGQYVLVDGGSPIGTYLNGHRIQQAVLTPGSQIQIGGFSLTFLVKGSRAPVHGPEMYGNQGYPIQHGHPQQPYPQQPYPQQPVQPQPTQMAPGQLYSGQAQPMPSMPTQAYTPNPAANQTVAYSPAQAGGVRSFALVAVDGPMIGQRFPLGGAVEIGREVAGILLAGDANASRRHAQVTPSAAGVQVVDMGSTNGTYLNGQRIQNGQANPGDVIKVGSSSFRVEVA